MFIRCVLAIHLICTGLVFVAAPLVEADKDTDEENYVLWRFEKGVAEGPAEIPKGVSFVLYTFFCAPPHFHGYVDMGDFLFPLVIGRTLFTSIFFV